MSEKKEASDIETGAAKLPSSLRPHCNGCGRDFADEDSYLNHIYNDDRCYRAYLASDRKNMGKE